MEIRINADLRQGGHTGVTAELQHLCAVHPLRERLHALLMLALYRCGRQAEALAAYQHLRTMLVEELGAEPGPELQTLHQQILGADPALAAPQPAAGAVPGAWQPGLRTGRAGWHRAVVPRQLPATVAALHRPGSRTEALARILPSQAATPPRSGGDLRRSAGRPGWARPRWPCTGRTRSPTGSPTGSCM